nr:MAG TPA: hypothetical protein [Caudoviricetes sp.]
MLWYRHYLIILNKLVRSSETEDHIWFIPIK